MQQSKKVNGSGIQKVFLRLLCFQYVSTQVHSVGVGPAVSTSEQRRPGEVVVSTSDLSEMDIQGFCRDIEELRGRVYANLGPDDIAHLKKIESRGRLSSLLGYATAWIFPNPLTAFLISFGQFTRWLLAHHILHRGYDKVPGIPKRYTSAYFGKGWRRFIDWFDWLHPVAWDYEHNQLHHYHTSEEGDPDLVERHTEFLRAARIPRLLKYLFVALASISWKYTYYAPNTMSVLDPERMKRIKHKHIVYITIKNIFEITNPLVRRLWVSGYLPYGTVHFVVIPLLFFPLGAQAVLFVLINKVIAECITNFHSFLVIGPNHAGEDLYRFDFHYNDKAEFYVTQVLGSVNYRTGNDVIDHLQIWLNYQIEHHIFPDLTMLKYQQIQPEVKSICQKHSVPYIQESIFTRFRKMVAVCVGAASMPKIHTFPDTLSVSKDDVTSTSPRKEGVEGALA